MKNKWIYLIIWVLTFFDIALTYTGVKIGFIEEANPLWNYAYTHYPEAISIILLCAVTGLILLIYKVQHKIKWIGYGLGVLLAAKLYISFLHIHWITILTKM